MADLKGGVIGKGFIGPAHIEALRRLGIEVVAVAGPRLDSVAEKSGQDAHWEVLRHGGSAHCRS
jgi:hypothetical protein